MSGPPCLLTGRQLANIFVTSNQKTAAGGFLRSHKKLFGFQPPKIVFSFLINMFVIIILIDFVIKLYHKELKKSILVLWITWAHQKIKNQESR